MGGETLTLVATDGTQHPPFRFPPGQHLALFLQCLEASLAPALLIQPPVGSDAELFPDPASKQASERFQIVEFSANPDQTGVAE